MKTTEKKIREKIRGNNKCWEKISIVKTKNVEIKTAGQKFLTLEKNYGKLKKKTVKLRKIRGSENCRKRNL